MSTTSTWLYKKYWVEKLSIPEIAREENINNTTVLYWMKKFKIPRRNKSSALVLFHQKKPKK
jgi:predicted DNA-binding protein YlxM (UPF0122 family)